MSGASEDGDGHLRGLDPPRHLAVVEKAVSAMHRREDGALCLRAMAETVNLSPYHFARTFRKVTGVPPGEFLTAWRLERAKDLLLGTDLGVAEICFEVGYESVGTFATRFKELVGLPPGKMRRLPERLHLVLGDIEEETWLPPPSSAESGVAFRVRGPDLGGCMIFVGLFPSAIPQGRPVAGTVLGKPGSCRLLSVPDGRYCLMAAALPRSRDPWKLLAPGGALRVGRARHPVTVRRGRAGGEAEVVLRPSRYIDPPVLVALPALLFERLTRARNGP